MTDLLCASLDVGAPLRAAVRRLPLTVREIPFPTGEADVSALRATAEAAAAKVTGFVLAVGAGRNRHPAQESGWADEVLTRLRTSFGLLTGAARRFRAVDAGRIVVVLPSAAFAPTDCSVPEAVFLRGLLGMVEALRAELQRTAVRVGIVFHDPMDDDVAALTARLEGALDLGQMYSLSADLPAARIAGYFAPMLDALSRTTAGPPLPDIGPMAAVYDAARVSVPPP